jgi:hypothetical protein
MNKTLNIYFFSRLLIILSLVCFLIALGADIFTGRPSTLGYRQVIGIFLAFLLLCIGIIGLWTVSGSGFAGLIKTNYRLLAFYLATCLGFSWLLYIFNTGIKFSPDSVSYQSFALLMHFSADFDVPAIWPPLYPFLLHIGLYVQDFPAESAAIVSGLSLVGTLVIFTLLLSKYSDNLWLITLFVLNLFFWNKFLSVYLHAWSESPFTFFLVLALFLVITHYERQNIWYFFFASVIVALVPFIRYTGLFLVGMFIGYTIYYLYLLRINRFSAIIKYLLISSISYLPIGLYLLKNYLESGTLFGQRTLSQFTLFGNLNRAIEVFIADINLYLRILIFVSLVLYVVIFIYRDRIKKAHNIFPLSFISGFIFFYTCFIIYTTTRAIVDPINTRYLAPLYPYLLLFSFISLNTMTDIEFLDAFKINSTRLYQIGIYSLIFLGFISSLREFNAAMHNISIRSYQPTAHPEAGFNISPTIDGINAYINKYLRNQDVIYLSVIMDYDPSYRQFFGPDILFREGIISSQNTSQYVFEDIQKYNNYFAIRNYTLSFQKGKGLKDINFLRAPPITNDRQMLEYLINATDENKTDTLILLVYQENLPLMEEDDQLSPTIAEYFDLASVESIDPYKIYELSRSN